MARKRNGTIKRQASVKTDTKVKKPAAPDGELPVAQKPAHFRYRATTKLSKELAKGDIQKAVDGSIKTCQPLARVVSIYLTRWRNLGLVKRI